MVPISSDPRWRQILTGAAAPQFKSAGAGMLIGRLRRSLIADPAPTNFYACVDQARAYFEKYERVMRDDLANVFGDGVKN